MSNFSIQEASPGKIALSGEFGIYQAAELKDALLQRLSANKALEIDLSGITELDSAGVQIMLLLQQEAKTSQKELHWCRHSPAVSRVLDILKLNSMLGEPVSLVWN